MSAAADAPTPPLQLLLAIGALPDRHPKLLRVTRITAVWVVELAAPLRQSVTQPSRSPPRPAASSDSITSNTACRCVLKRIVPRDGLKLSFRLLNHSNIVKYFSHYEFREGEHWIVMECCEGRALSVVIDDWRNPATSRGAAVTGNRDDILGIMRQLLAAVTYLHVTAKLIHRDLKPDNIIVRADGHVTVIDLDLLKASPLAEGHRDTGWHTLSYAAPERLREPPSCTPASDMWAVGCILYELISLRPAFDRRDSILAAQYVPLRFSTSPARLVHLGDPAWFDRMCQLTDALLQRDPSQRLDVTVARRLPGDECRFGAASQHVFATAAREREIEIREQLAEAFKDSFRYMELSVTSDDVVERLQFQDVFVLIHVEEGNQSTGGVGVARKKIRPSQVPRLAEDHNHRVVLIEAEAGWGKSTLLRDLARTQGDRSSLASSYVTVHADLRALLDTTTAVNAPPRSGTAAPACSQLYRTAAAAAASLVSDHRARCRISGADVNGVVEFLTSPHRMAPVVWLFDALDEVSANKDWDPAVQALIRYKIMPWDIVIFAARPSSRKLSVDGKGAGAHCGWLTPQYEAAAPLHVPPQGLR